MSVKLPDRRIRKTQDALGRAFMALLQRQSWEDISVQMICDRADVARSSFYMHFDNKVELLDHLIAVALTEARAQIAKAGHPTTEIGALSWLVDHIMGNREFFLKMAQSVSGQIVFSRFREAVQTMVSDEIMGKGQQRSEDVSYILGGSFGLIERWILSGKPAKSAEMKASLQAFAARVLMPML
jgi:AcrR family transcriptional regulator